MKEIMKSIRLFLDKSWSQIIQERIIITTVIESLLGQIMCFIYIILNKLHNRRQISLWKVKLLGVQIITPHPPDLKVCIPNHYYMLIILLLNVCQERKSVILQVVTFQVLTLFYSRDLQFMQWQSQANRAGPQQCIKS